MKKNILLFIILSLLINNYYLLNASGDDIKIPEKEI